jgi:site-specific recombinase XerD
LKLQDFAFLPPLAQQYLRFVRQAGKSDLTVIEYASDLRLFFRYIGDILPQAAKPSADDDDQTWMDADYIKQITVEHGYQFLQNCETDKDNCARTRARRVVAIKRFYNYLTVVLHIFDRNPMLELTAPRFPKALPKYLTEEDCIKLLDTICNTDSPFAARDLCMVVLFLNCGMRLTELCTLNVTDIRTDGTLRILGKGAKERTVYLNEACMTALSKYLVHRPQDKVLREDRNALFISRNNRRITQRSVELMLEKYLKQCGLDQQGISIHKLRHTAATLMYQNDVDLLELKEILGHENLSTTEIYTHVVSAQLRAAVDKNPLAGYNS